MDILVYVVLPLFPGPPPPPRPSKGRMPPHFGTPGPCQQLLVLLGEARGEGLQPEELLALASGCSGGGAREGVPFAWC